MAAANTDKLRKLSRKWVGQIGSGGVSDAVVTTIPLASTTNLATDTAVTLVIDRVDSAGVKTPNKEETIVGVVSGSNIVNSVRGVEGTAQAHDAGAVVEVLVTADGYNDIIDHLLVGHLQDGRHSGSAITASNIAASAITSGTIAASAVVAGNLAASSVVSGNLAASAVVSGNISASAVVLGNLSASSVSEGNLNFSLNNSTDGWTAATGTWTYASASTITVPSGAASIYQRGDKIKFTQTTAKYAIIIDVADTLLTIAVNNDYTVANAAITSPYYSHASNPLGFPSAFNYTPTYTFTAGAAPSGAVSNNNAEFTVNGGFLFVRASRIYAVAGTTVTRCDISLPFTVNSSVDQTVVGGGCFSNGTAPVTTYNQVTTTTAQLFCGSSTIDRLGFSISLEI